MFDSSGVSPDRHSWGDIENSYDEACRLCEIEVAVDSEETRKQIINDGGLRYDKRQKGKWLVMQMDAPALKSKKWDRLDPNKDPPYTSHIFHKPAPFVCSFWRCHRDKKGRLLDRLHRRSPLFCIGVGVDEIVLLTDTLHTLYLGIYSRCVFEVMMTALEEEIWGIGGTKDERNILA
eukprot:4143210-Pyramimonas_sp.AAC.1